MSDLHDEVLKRLADIGRPSEASVVACHGERLNVAATWGALGDLWCDGKVTGYPEGPWALEKAAEPTEGQLELGGEA